MVKPIAAQPRRSASLTEPVTAWSLAVARLLELLTLRMVGIGAREAVGAGLDHAERGRIGREAGIDRELEMIVRVIGVGVRREAARGPCSKPWSTGRITSLPVPPRRPSIRMRARLAFVPGLSLS